MVFVVYSDRLCHFVRKSQFRELLGHSINNMIAMSCHIDLRLLTPPSLDYFVF